MYLKANARTARREQGLITFWRLKNRLFRVHRFWWISESRICMKNICDQFPISNTEYLSLEKEFGQLTKYAAWQLLKKNAKNNHTDDFDDINQELLMSIIRAGSYYKRQIYIEKCFVAVKKCCDDKFLCLVIAALEHLWKNRTRHGANRQKFGGTQEKLLDKIIKTLVPLEHRPDKYAHLKIDNKFATYCKAITWNAQKSMGRKITREKSLRTGLVSLGDFEYLAQSNF